MIGAELRNWIFKELGLDIPFQQLLSPTLTIAKFAIEVCAKQGIMGEPGTTRGHEPPAPYPAGCGRVVYKEYLSNF